MKIKSMSIHDRIDEIKKKYKGPKFMGIPDEWYVNTHWWCNNEHVNSMYLKSELKGDLCLTCQQPVRLGPEKL